MSRVGNQWPTPLEQEILDYIVEITVWIAHNDFEGTVYGGDFISYFTEEVFLSNPEREYAVFLLGCLFGYLLSDFNPGV
jgi:hypothetical protein